MVFMLLGNAAMECDRCERKLNRTQVDWSSDLKRKEPATEEFFFFVNSF